MKIIKDIEQGSKDWFDLRLGKLTASNFHLFLGNSKTRKTEIEKKAAEIITKKRCDQDNFRNIHTDRGHELEPIARDAYTFETGNNIEEVSFILGDDFTGCSPDGLVGDDGLIEIKCLDNHIFLAYKNKGDDYIKPEHKTQIQFCLMVSGRKWVDYVVFNPNFGGKGLIIKRVERDDEYIKKIREAISRAVGEIKEEVTKFN